jgi:predicted DNA-binding protein (MmcQ/YjbR family)
VTPDDTKRLSCILISVTTAFKINLPKMTAEQFSALALSFPNTVAAPHFDRTAFKVVNKKIFATMHTESNTVNLKFSREEQSVYCLINKDAIYPVKNKWGLHGFTTFELDKVDEQLMLEALQVAYDECLKTTKKR